MAKKAPKYRWRVDIIETERGWGSKVDHSKTFQTEKEATEWSAAYNKKYNNEPVVPAWYMYASAPQKEQG